MQGRMPIFYSALMLTGVNLLLRMAGTSFQVYLSARIGEAGIGLLQLVGSVGSLAMITGMAGVRTAAMYLTAEELGKKRAGTVKWVLSGCFGYSILCSGAVALALYRFAPWIAEHWIGNSHTVDALQLYAAFLPVVCLCGVMSGYFTAANRIGALAAVEVGEQFFSISMTMLALCFWAGTDAERACCSIILGSGIASCLTLIILLLLRMAEHPVPGSRIPIFRRLTEAAVPLAVADVMKAGINTTENLMVPKRLALNSRISDPLASFGLVSGMVFPVLMFPACILFGLTELLIPELARCAAAGSRTRIRYLVRRSLRVAMLYGLLFGGLEFLLADTLCLKLYQSLDAARYLKLYALLIPMLYCDAITDAMTKGLGQQKICVRYNILTSALDVCFLFFLLPEYGMMGYFLSFAVTHLINFLLSLGRLLNITGQRLPVYEPILAVSALLAAVLGASRFTSSSLRMLSFFGLFGSLLCLLGVTGREDLRWIKGLLHKK